MPDVKSSEPIVGFTPNIKDKKSWLTERTEAWQGRMWGTSKVGDLTPEKQWEFLMSLFKGASLTGSPEEEPGAARAEREGADAKAQKGMSIDEGAARLLSPVLAVAIRDKNTTKHQDTNRAVRAVWMSVLYDIVLSECPNPPIYEPAVDASIGEAKLAHPLMLGVGIAPADKWSGEPQPYVLIRGKKGVMVVGLFPSKVGFYNFEYFKKTFDRSLLSDISVPAKLYGIFQKVRDAAGQTAKELNAAGAS